MTKEARAVFFSDRPADQDSDHASVSDEELDDPNNFHDADILSRQLQVLRPRTRAYLNPRPWTSSEAKQLFDSLQSGSMYVSDLLEARHFPRMSDFPAEFSKRNILGTALKGWALKSITKILLQYRADPNEIVEETSRRISALIYAIKINVSANII